MIRGGLVLSLFLTIATQAELVPLTNTRYGPAGTNFSRLVSNGSDFFLFWASRDVIRVTRLDDGEPRPGLPVMTERLTFLGSFDVVWTGSHFLVAYEDADSIYSLPVDEDGQALRDRWLVARNASAPRLAFNGSTVLLLATSGNETISMTLDLDGIPTRSSQPVHNGTVLGLTTGGSEFAAVLSAFSVNGRRELWLALFTETGRQRLKLVVDSPISPVVATVAGHAGDFLLLRCDSRQCDTRRFTREGNTSQPTVIHELEPTEEVTGPAAVWNGEGWTIAYLEHSEHPTTIAYLKHPQDRKTIVHVARLDWTARTILDKEERPGAGTPALAAIGSRVKAAWQEQWNEAFFAADLPLRENEAQVATYLPAAQTLLATATSSEALLVVWSELINNRQTLHAGVRRRSGQWLEREIGAGEFLRATAATDGRELAIAFTSDTGATVMGLTSWGWPRWSVEAEFWPQAMAWNGREYGLIGVGFAHPYRAMMATITPDGQLSDTEILRDQVFVTSIASDGTGFLKVFSGQQVVAEREDGVTFVLDESAFSEHPVASWDGVRYVVTWHDERGRVTARIPASGPGEPIIEIDRRPEEPELVATATIDGAPHYSVPRVVIAAAEVAKPQPPTIVDVDESNGAFFIAWRPSPSPSVTGYRLEYRVADGLWKEDERWIAPARRGLIEFVPAVPGEIYEFRMRAISDAGLSDYSSSASTARSSIACTRCGSSDSQ